VVSRCANPSCEAQFKYLHEGRLFQFAAANTSIRLAKSRLNFEFWWLCGQCCSSMTLIQSGSTGVRVVPLPYVTHGSSRERPMQVGATA
jgi:hypothetical protein